MGVKDVEMFEDSQLVVQHMLGKYQCLDGILNDYPERCWDIVRSFNEFNIHHLFCFENSRANGLAHEALGYRIT
jgi:ribonuclease HI